jgi:hypothetical protein
MEAVLASGDVWLATTLLHGMTASFPSDLALGKLRAKADAMQAKDEANPKAALKEHRGAVARTDSILLGWVLREGVLEVLKPLWDLMDDDAELGMALAARFLALFPWCVSGDEMLAEATGRCRGIDAAAPLYLEALAKGSRNNSIAINAALVYMQRQLFREAQNALKLVAKRNPTAEQAHRAKMMLQVVEALLVIDAQSTTAN